MAGWPLAATLDGERGAVVLTPEPPPATARLVLWRVSPSGASAYVRGWAPPGGVYTPPQTVRDYEVPFGVEVDYFGTAYDAGGVSLGDAEPVAFTVPAQPTSDPWLCDIARPLNSQPVTLEAFAELAYQSPSGVHRVLNRRSPIVTGDLSWTPAGRLVFCTLDELARERARGALGNGVPVLLRTPPEQGVGNAYLFPLSFTEARVSRLALHAERRFTVEVVQVDRPDPTLYAPRLPGTYADLVARYASYADVLAAYPTYDALLYDYTDEADAPPPWPPDDV